MRRALDSFIARTLPAVRVAVLLASLSLRTARAEDSIAYKFQDYQEADGRIGVKVHSTLIEKDLGREMTLRIKGVIDTISGATPNGQPPPSAQAPVPMSALQEKRKAWTAEITRILERGRLSAGFATSRESDYVSKGGSLNVTWDFNEKNSTATLGASATDDDAKVFYQSSWERKQTLDLLCGLTQLVSPETSITFNLSHSRASGYQSDPYKLVQKNTEVFPGLFLPLTFGENRPHQRDRWTLLAALNRAFPEILAAMDASWRVQKDDFGLTSHALTWEWFQNLGKTVIIKPHVRHYVQDAADFYSVSLSGSQTTPSRVPTGRSPYYSADYRLSALRTLNAGLKLVWMANDHVTIDFAIETYEMKGRDRGATSRSAYPRARIVTSGVKYAF